jgi:hypothetical protein
MTTGNYGWRHRLTEPLIQRLAPPLHVALRDLQKRYLDRRGMDLKSYFQSSGRDVRIPGCLTVTDPASVAVGHGVSVGEDGYWSSAGGLTVGDRARIGRRVIIETVERAAGPQHEAHPRPVMIGPDVWVGDGAVLQPGTRLGAGVAVASGATVSGDVPGPAASAPRGGHSGHGDDPATRLFFVVSTGRSGSQTIARVLSQHPGVKCLHEPRPQMIRLSTELAHGIKTAADVEEELRAIFCESSVFPADRMYGESDQKYWNLIPILARLLPNSRFIWLIRDGRDVAASKYATTWFREEEKQQGTADSADLTLRWMHYREDGARAGCFSGEQWTAMPVFEKICWSWQHVNEGIEREIGDLPRDRWAMIRLEELEERIGDLFWLLAVDSSPVKVEQHNRSAGAVKRWEEWDSSMRRTFEARCGAGMDRWFPAWRNPAKGTNDAGTRSRG